MDEALKATSISDRDEFALSTDVKGPKTLQRKLRRLVDKYKKCFRKNVAKTAANIPPMKLNVNVEEWTKSTQSKGRYRPQSDAKHEEIERQVQLLLALKVIKRSKVANYSHVHLVRKRKINGDFVWILGF